MPHLVLFFTQGKSLQEWHSTGILEREVAIYRQYVKKGWKVSFVTYGNAHDLSFQPLLEGIEILCNQWNLDRDVYEQTMLMLHGNVISTADIIKTNQMKGAEIAAFASKFWKIPLVFRCGFLWSSVVQERAEKGLVTEVDSATERDIFTHATKMIVTTDVMKQYIQNTYSIPEDKVFVVPNYIEIDVFKPLPIKKNRRQICCIAKFNEKKNHFNLLKACAGLDVHLLLLGQGPLEADVRALASELNIHADFLGHRPNHQLPEILNESEIAILPSLIEGHPKALLEAMSCGRPVIGSNVLGIKEILQHRHNGFVCETDAASIRSAIQTVLNDKHLQTTIGHHARLFIEEHFTLEQSFAKELAIMNSIVTP